ncbi:universal stress protein [Aquimarina algicola]|uniref:Universal stress protein n=1 Tax=Aquimarina algicola TaxID=2589995 RepID=A0A504JIM0_9FLAO|nr:universal stress protein [Aquimarina algicola]TPN87473.1 universal stress protein [Aquimarina algicola]
MRKILIPTDFSENAMNALRYAVELNKYEYCEFFIIHAYDDSNSDKAIDTACIDEELVKVLSDIRKISPNPRHQYKTMAILGNLVDNTNDLVDQENIDILIMGTRGKTDDRKMTFGSNTLQVVRYVKCPVLAIPNGCKYTQPKNILFPTDYLMPFRRRELKLLSTLTKSFRSIVNFLYVSDYEKLSTRQEDHKKFISTSLPEAELKFCTTQADDLTEAINQFIEKNEIDFLVMVNSRNSYLESILYQSTIDKIGLHIKIPFLAMQNLDRN